ncbi:MAG: hypothetical protein N3D72_04250 [Candidatus Methanomethyliaceae archaeon]|nr:hypothetical protein [Candidatus Methanomethyliaceae archaeon]
MERADMINRVRYPANPLCSMKNSNLNRKVLIQAKLKYAKEIKSIRL